MNKGASNILMLAVGGVLGSVATLIYTQKKYSELVEKEIQKTKEYYEKEPSKLVISFDKDENDICDESKSHVDEKTEQTIQNIIKESGYDQSEYSDYTKYSKPDEKLKQKELEIFESDENIPIVIAPEQFGNIEEYSTEGFTYYQNGVITDDDGDVVDPEKVKRLLGLEFKNHFGEYEDDSTVYLQNDTLQAYYEIIAEPYDYD